MIQLAAGFCSLVNGGDYYAPHIMKQIVNEDGAVIENNEPTILRKTVSEETSNLLKEYMYQTVEAGTGKRAKVEGYSIGGKTGTAEKQPRGNNKYLISFIGFAPVEKPQIVLYVTVDEPNEAEQSHSGASSILARDIFTEVLPYMNVFQSSTSVDDGSAPVDEQSTPVQVDDVQTTENGSTEAGAAATEGTSAEGSSTETGTTSTEGGSSQ